MNAVMSDDGFPEMLRNAIWHTTRPDRFESIRCAGEVIANPDIPDAERWKTSRGPDHYPYVRHIGGISLFDFHDFDPIAYSKACPMSSWRIFVPVRQGWSAAVWLKIDVTKVSGEYFSPKDLADRQHTENAHRHTLMPHIEAAVVGSIPLDAIQAGYIIYQGSGDIKELSIHH
ncbi:MAG: hypothetical protein C4522_11810 [Desulfobacteraceae bacterium]|nr:MAG: hypothetical protein C4522_11810 [Desulfobacteraceae bacterium]